MHSSCEKHCANGCGEDRSGEQEWDEREWAEACASVQTGSDSGLELAGNSRDGQKG